MHHSIIEDPVNGRADQERRGPAGSLGITAKSSPPPSREIGAREARAARYQALNQARVWMVRRFEAMPIEDRTIEKPDGSIRVLAYPGDVFRTADCRYHKTDTCVEVRFSRGMPANYRNLATCGSVWACPVCAARIRSVAGWNWSTLLNGPRLRVSRPSW